VKLVFSDLAWDQYHYWINADPKVFEKLNALINEARHSPFKAEASPNRCGAVCRGGGHGGSPKRIGWCTGSPAERPTSNSKSRNADSTIEPAAIAADAVGDLAFRPPLPRLT